MLFRSATGLLPTFAFATTAIWAQAVLGGMVSTNHASLVCPDWPTCNGEWAPPMVGLVALQMGHRFGAYALILVLALVAWRSRSAPDGSVRAIARLLFALVLVQAAIGVANVWLRVPVWASALHLANAALMLALSVVATFRSAAQPAGEYTQPASRDPGRAPTLSNAKRVPMSRRSVCHERSEERAMSEAKSVP